MNLDEEICNNLSNEISKEIDAEILRGFYREIGWTEVVLKPITQEHDKEIDDWINANIKESFWNYGLVWMFENDKDANWFMLRWL